VSEQPYERTSGPVHGWFGLTYSSYQVLPRVLMQSMPLEWQHRMVACLEEMRAAFEHVEKPDSYKVEPVEWVAPSDLSEAQMRLVGVTRDFADEDEEDDATTVYHDRDGTELDEYRECVALPVGDTLPGYRHGYVAPAERAS
jgi:hypothetical protein